MLRAPVLLIAATLALAGLTFAPAAGAKGKKKGDDPVVSAFVEAYGAEDAKERTAAIEKLTDAPDATKLAVLQKYVIPKEKRADVLYRAVGVLSRIKDEAVVEKLVAAAKSGKPKQQIAYVEALGSIDGTPAHVALIELLEHKDQGVRGMAAYALGEHRAMDALEPLLGLLDDRFWQVQSAALAAIRRLRDKDVLKAVAVPRIVTYLENVTGRMSVDAADTLARITGRKLGRDPKKWHDFMAGKDVKAKGAEEKAEKAGGVYGDAAERPHFYGMEVLSNRVVLIMDISLSMNDPIEIDKDRLRRETSRRKAITGAKAEESGEPIDEDHAYDIPWWRIKSRLDLAREQTIMLISQLRDEQYFDIIFYSTEVEAWMGKLVPATTANKQKAITALQEIKPDDKTNTWGAIARAFDLVNNEKKSAQTGPDEMYLVTDGAPSAGDIIDPNTILDAVIQLHKTKRIRINCIGIGVNLRFMRKMCRATGGQAKFFTD